MANQKLTYNFALTRIVGALLPTTIFSRLGRLPDIAPKDLIRNCAAPSRTQQAKARKAAMEIEGPRLITTMINMAPTIEMTLGRIKMTVDITIITAGVARMIEVPIATHSRISNKCYTCHVKLCPRKYLSKVESAQSSCELLTRSTEICNQSISSLRFTTCMMGAFFIFGSYPTLSITGLIKMT